MALLKKQLEGDRADTMLARPGWHLGWNPSVPVRRPCRCCV